METATITETLDTNWLETKDEPPAWVWALHQEWAKERDKQEGRYASRYVDEIKMWIAAKIPFPLNEKQMRNLSGQVYNCNRWEDRIRKEQEKNAMIAQGWEVLSVEFVKNAAQSGRKVEVCRRGYNLLMNEVEKIEVMRPLVNPKGDAFLMPKGARTRGFEVRRMMQSDSRIFVHLARA